MRRRLALSACLSFVSPGECSFSLPMTPFRCSPGVGVPAKLLLCSRTPSVRLPVNTTRARSPSAFAGCVPSPWPRLPACRDAGARHSPRPPECSCGGTPGAGRDSSCPSRPGEMRDQLLFSEGQVGRAGARWDTAGEDSALIRGKWSGAGGRGPLSRKSGLMPFSAILAVARISGCHPDTECRSAASGEYCSPWAAPERWHWTLADVQPLPDPVPCRAQENSASGTSRPTSKPQSGGSWQVTSRDQAC